jgi:excisionase family DNA binding protein
MNPVDGPARRWLMDNPSVEVNDLRESISQHEMDGTDTSSEPLWTVEDVATYLQLQPETIRSMARRGELPALKIGKVWRFQKHAIHAMLINIG